MSIEGPRAVRKGELRSAMELERRVFRMHWDSSPEWDLSIPDEGLDLERWRVFADEGRVVSVVGVSEHEISLLGVRHLGCCFGGVCTDPDYRGRGLATQLLIDARGQALRRGADIALISGSRGLYRRLGYVSVGGYHVCTVKRSRLPPGGGCVLRPWRPEDAPALVSICAAERARWVRTPQEFLERLKGGGVGGMSGETKIVCPRDRDEPVAYIAYQIGGWPWEKKDRNAVSVAEMGGSRWAIAQVLGALLDERKLSSLTLHCPDCDTEMAELARTFGWPAKPHGFRGTVGIIDPERFWQHCMPLFAERLGRERAGRLRLDANGSVRITYGCEAVELDGMGGITKLVFLPSRRRKELDLGLGADSQLARALDELFPLPLVDWGLNYA